MGNTNFINCLHQSPSMRIKENMNGVSYFMKMKKRNYGNIPDFQKKSSIISSQLISK